MGDNCCSSLLGSHEQGFQEDKGVSPSEYVLCKGKGKDNERYGHKKGVPLYSNLC